MADPEQDPLGRGKMTQARRIELLEHDRHQQSRMITELVDKVGKGFTEQQLGQIRAVMLDVFSDVGLRVDGADQQDEARRDFMFLRAFRRATNGLAAKIGWLVIAALCGGIIWLINAGLTAWKAGP